MLLKENNPWVGLASYKSQDAARFYGREKETRQLSELIQSNYCTILYGKSGAGKTSLIQAGVCPLLSEEHFLPIPLKLEHSGAVPYTRQITDKVEEEIRRIGGEVEFPVELPDDLDEDSRTWLFFHTANFWDAQNFRTVPALFIDQFEEIFNLTADISQVMGFFRTIDTLLQMTPPEPVSEAFARTDRRLPFKEKPAFRLMLSLREDFLARLEDYSFNIPALRRNRIGLASMNGLQALEVITRPIPGLVQRDAALRILSKVTADDVRDDEYFLEKLTVDSCILSLFCTEIYNKSAESGKDGISMEVIDQFGNNIIQTYYERNMDAISAASTRYLEAHLLTTNGFRNQVALEDLVPDHVKMEEITKLESSRIVRIETVNGTERVEFTHDVLCKVAADHRSAGNLKNEKRKATVRRIAYALEVILHAGIVAAFLFSPDVKLMSLLRDNPFYWALTFLAFTAFFLIRLEHHSGRYKSPLVMVVCAVFSWMPLILLESVVSLAPDDLDAMLAIYGFTGLIYPFVELARQKRSQNLKFLLDSVRLTEDRDRWAAVLAFLVLSYGAAAVFAHRMVNETISYFLLLFLPVLLLESFCFLFPESTDKRARWTWGLMAGGGMFLLILSQYRYSRLWYYAALLLLAASCVVFVHRLILRQKDLKYEKAVVPIWIILFILLPSYLLGYDPMALQRVARVPHGTIATESYPNMITVKGKDGLKGVVLRNETILPPEFDDIRTYAMSTRKDLDLPVKDDEFDGTVRDLVFYVKEGGDDSWQKLPLSQAYRVRNSITKAIADDYRHALDIADSTYVQLFKAPRKDGNAKDAQKENAAQTEIMYHKDWDPFRFAYDPAIQIFLASQAREGVEKRAHTDKALALLSAMGTVRQYRKKGHWSNDKKSVLRALAYVDFYQRTGTTSNFFIDAYNQYLKENETSLAPLPTILGAQPDSILQTILETPALRENAYLELSQRENRDIYFQLLSMENPATRDFLSSLMELEDSSAVNRSFYSMFQKDYAKAEALSREAFASADNPDEKGIAISNLIPALFLGGNEEECREQLDKFAFYRTSNGYLVIHALYTDIIDYLHHGVLKRNTSDYERYLQLLGSYSENIFQNRKTATWKNATFYYKGLTRDPCFFKLKDVTLFFNSPDSKSYDALMVPWDSSIGLTVIGDRKGFVNLESGKEIYPVQADHAWLFSEGLAVIEEENRLRVLDADGEPAFEKTFPDPRDFDNPDFAAVDFVYHDGVCPMIDSTGRFGLIDTEGNWVIQPEYDYITNPDEEGYRHLLKDGNLSRMGHLELESGTSLPTTPLMIGNHRLIRLWDPRGSRWFTWHKEPDSFSSTSVADGPVLVMSFYFKDSTAVFFPGRRDVLSVPHADMSVTLSPDAGRFVSYDSDYRTAYLTDLTTHATDARFTVNSEASGFSGFCFSQDGKRAASYHEDKTFRFWDVASGECLYEFSLTDYCSESPSSLALSRDGSCLIAGLHSFDDNLVYCRLGQKPILMDVHEDFVRCVGFSPDGKWFATGSDDRTLILYDAQTRRKVRTINTDGNWLVHLAFSPDNRQIATLDNHGKLDVWDIRTGDPIASKYLDFDTDELTLFSWPDNRQ